MFYFDGERWSEFKNKISYTERVVLYDDDIWNYEGKENLLIEPNILSAEEKERLETIKSASHLSLIDVLNYVKSGIVPDHPEFIQARILKDERDMIQSLIDVTTASTEDLLKLPSLIEKWDHKAHYKAGAVVNHKKGLFLVKIEHDADKSKPPERSPDLYEVRIQPTADVIPPSGDYPAYDPNMIYKKGQRITVDLINYECAKNNVTQPPKMAPNYWKQL